MTSPNSYRFPNLKFALALPRDSSGNVTLPLAYLVRGIDTSRICLRSEYLRIRTRILRLKIAYDQRIRSVAHTHIDLEVVLIWKSITHIIDILEFSQNDLCHLVQSGLYAGTVICRKSRQCRIFDAFKCGIKDRSCLLDVANIFEQSPSVAGSDLCREDSVIHIRKESVFIFDVSVEGRSSRFKNQQILQARGDFEPFSADVVRLCHTDIVPITKERVFMGFPINEDSSPFMLNDGASSTGNMPIGSGEM